MPSSASPRVILGAAAAAGKAVGSGWHDRVVTRIDDHATVGDPSTAALVGASGSRGPRAVFAGLCTVDVAHLVERVPAENEKTVSLAQHVSAGGPAANAAAACAFLGATTTLLTGIGAGVLGGIARADLAAVGVEVVDLAPDFRGHPATSSVLVTRATGARTVVSRNAGDYHLVVPGDVAGIVHGADIVEVDGHHPALALAVAGAARDRGRFVVLDGGSWKPVTERLLPLVDAAVCSADFRPPGTGPVTEVVADLHRRGVGLVAVTRGAAPVVCSTGSGTIEVPVPRVEAVDTLGAGDVFHGALCHALGAVVASGATITAEAFRRGLEFAGRLAAASCETFGTRAWMSASGRR